MTLHTCVGNDCNGFQANTFKPDNCEASYCMDGSCTGCKQHTTASVAMFGINWYWVNCATSTKLGCVLVLSRVLASRVHSIRISIQAHGKWLSRSCSDAHHVFYTQPRVWQAFRCTTCAREPSRCVLRHCVTHECYYDQLSVCILR